MQHNIKTEEKQQDNKGLIARIDPELKPEILEVRSIMESETNDVVSMTKVISDLLRRGLQSYKAA